MREEKVQPKGKECGSRQCNLFAFSDAFKDHIIYYRVAKYNIFHVNTNHRSSICNEKSIRTSVTVRDKGRDNKTKGRATQMECSELTRL